MTVAEMNVRVFDTLQRAKVPLSQRDPGKLSIYVCGPTVYDAPHVGHGRTALVYDVIRRYLEWTGVDVTYVSNVTDVEDKIITRASERGTSERELAAQYEADYWAQLDRTDARRPDMVPRATEYIAAMLDLIRELVERSHAYVVEGKGVYFDVTTFPSYGELPHRTIEQLLDSAGQRVDVDDEKHSPLDFALWKAAKPGEPSWDSPWGVGRPGWHIECSAMSLGLLGEGFDLHGAGSDLIFPHHENERAQAEAAGHPFARHWIHSGMVQVGGEKMAKSVGNFTTLEAALDEHGPRAFRLAVLQTHYRRDTELGDPELEQAGEAVKRLDALVRRVDPPADAPRDDALVARFRAAMDDDFSTPAAVGAVFDAVAEANRAHDAGDHERAASLTVTVCDLLGVLGLTIGSEHAADDEIDALVAQRDEARRTRDFAEADRIRDELAARGITLEDGAGATTWHRT